MADIIVAGSVSGAGTMTVQAPVTSANRVLTLEDATGTLAPLVSATAQTASGTSVNFVDIPSWVKRITVMFSGVSTNGTSVTEIRLGTSSGVENSGYAGTFFVTESTAFGSAGLSTGFVVDGAIFATDVRSGSASFMLTATNTWVGTGIFATSNKARYASFSGTKTLASTLTQVRITMVNGTDSFDAGTINILYE